MDVSEAFGPWLLPLGVPYFEENKLGDMNKSVDYELVCRKCRLGDPILILKVWWGLSGEIKSNRAFQGHQWRSNSKSRFWVGG